MNLLVIAESLGMNSCPQLLNVGKCFPSFSQQAAAAGLHAASMKIAQILVSSHFALQPWQPD